MPVSMHYLYRRDYSILENNSCEDNSNYIEGTKEEKNSHRLDKYTNIHQFYLAVDQ